MKRALVVAGGLLLATAAALVVLALLAASQGERLLAAASAALGREVRADDVGIHLGLGVGVSLENVRLAADPAVGAKEPLVAAERVDLRVRVLPLLRRQIVVEHVLVDAPTVTLVRNRSGRLNVGDLGAKGEPKTPPGAPAPAERAEPRPSGPDAEAPAALPTFQIATLRVRDGTLRYRDEVTGRSTELLELATDGRQPSLAAPMPVSFRARLVSPDLTLDGISGSGVLDLAADPPTYRGDVEGGPGRLGKIPLERLRARIEARPPQITLEESRVDLLGGSATARARIGAPGRWLTASVTVEGLDLEQLPREPSKPYPGGILGLTGNVAGPSPSNPAFELALTGEGRFTVADGRVAGLTVGRTLRDLLKLLLSDSDERRLRERHPELFGGDELRFTKLEGSGRLGQGRIRTNDLVVAAPSYEMRGEGYMGLDGELDLTLRLAASPALTEDLIGSESVRKRVVDASGRLMVPLQVGGTVRRPKVTPDPRFAAALATGVLGGSDVGEAASGLLERLLRPKRRRER